MSSLVKGWCPSLLRPMQAADGWLLRLKPHLGLLTAEQADEIAALSETLGNGQLELTQRAGLQIRGLPEETLDAAAKSLIALGLAHPDPAVEARRNIIVSPLAGADETLKSNIEPIVKHIERNLESDPNLQELPDKFGFVVDSGGVLPLHGISADIVLRCSLGRIELAGRYALQLKRQSDQAQIAIELAKAFAKSRRHRRLAALLMEMPVTAFVESAGIDCAVQELSDAPVEPPAPGFHGESKSAFLAVWPFGALTAGNLHATAKAARRYGDGKLRITPWRALAIAGISSEDVEALAGSLADAGALTDRNNPLLRIEACPGHGACAEASVNTRALAYRLAELISREGKRLHLSGCSKGCAYPRPASLTLVGNKGAWAVVRDGRADALPQQERLSEQEVLDLARHA